MKKTLVFVVAVLLAFQVTAWWAEDAAAQGKEQKMKIRLAHVFTLDHPVHQGMLRANEILQQKTGGRLELQIYPTGSYAAYKDAIRGVRMGTLDMCPLDTAIDYYPASGVMLGPYTFRDYDHWKKFKKSNVYQELLSTIGEKVGVKQLSLYTFGFRHATTKNLVAKTPKDFENFKLRVVDFPPYPEAATILGAVGTALPIGDVYMALSTGVADGQENPFTQILTMKFYEVQKYLLLTGHMLATSGVIIAKKTWDGLNAQDQAAVMEAFQIGADRIDELVIEKEKTMLADLKSKGMTVVEIDKKPFMERVPIVLKKYPEWTELYNKIQAIK
jgi:tripartite ATP-independent transporter DctP family solute receptor